MTVDMCRRRPRPDRACGEHALFTPFTATLPCTRAIVLINLVVARRKPVMQPASPNYGSVRTVRTAPVMNPAAPQCTTNRSEGRNRANRATTRLVRFDVGQPRRVNDQPMRDEDDELDGNDDDIADGDL